MRAMSIAVKMLIPYEQVATLSRPTPGRVTLCFFEIACACCNGVGINLSFPRHRLRIPIRFQPRMPFTGTLGWWEQRTY